MLERKTQSPEENEQYQKKSIRDVIWSAKIKIHVCRNKLEKLGEDTFLNIDKMECKGSHKYLTEMPKEEREDMLCFLKRFPTLSDEELAKHYIKESEFYWGV